MRGRGRVNKHICSGRHGEHRDGWKCAEHLNTMSAEREGKGEQSTYTIHVVSVGRGAGE